MIYLKRCKLKMPHDFEDHPCKKCNGIILEDLFFRFFSPKNRVVRITIGSIMVIVGWIMIFTSTP